MEKQKEEKKAKRKGFLLNINAFKQEADNYESVAEYKTAIKERNKGIFILIFAVLGVLTAAFLYVLFFSATISLFEIKARKHNQYVQVVAINDSATRFQLKDVEKNVIIDPWNSYNKLELIKKLNFNNVNTETKVYEKLPNGEYKLKETIADPTTNLDNIYAIEILGWEELFIPGGPANRRNSSILWSLTQTGEGVAAFVYIGLLLFLLALTALFISGSTVIIQIIIVLIKSMYYSFKTKTTDVVEALKETKNLNVELAGIEKATKEVKEKPKKEKKVKKQKQEKVQEPEKTLEEIVEEKRRKIINEEKLIEKEKQTETKPEFNIFEQ